MKVSSKYTHSKEVIDELTLPEVESFQQGGKLPWQLPIDRSTLVRGVADNTTTVRSGHSKPAGMFANTGQYVNNSMGREAGTISAYDKSPRERLLSTLYKVSNVGNGALGGALTSPLISAAKLVKPGAYFEGVNSDAKLGDAVANIGGDLINALPVIEGVGMAGRAAGKIGKRAIVNAERAGKKWLNVVPGEKNNPIANMSIDELNSLPEHEYTRLIESEYDPRTRAELLVDNLHESKLGRGVTNYMQKAGERGLGKKMKDARAKIVYNHNVDTSPFTPENIARWSQGNKRLMRGENMVAIREGESNDSVKALLASTPGDRGMANVMKGWLGKKHTLETNYGPDFGLINDPTKGHPGMFSAQLDPMNREISNYSFFNREVPGTPAHKAKEFAAGKFANDLIKHGPEDYIYAPGRLSGDSHKLFNRAIVKNKNMLEPADSMQGRFGYVLPMNSYGKNSEVSKLLQQRSYAQTPEEALGINNMIKANIDNVHTNTFDALGLKDRSLINNVQPGEYINTPVKKLPKGVGRDEGNVFRINYNTAKEGLTQARINGMPEEQTDMLSDYLRNLLRTSQ